MGRRRENTEQILLRVQADIVERLDAAILSYGLRSRQQVLVEIVETYFDFWEELQEQKAATIRAQREAMRYVPERKRA